ncbi:hypothetical protein BX18_17980 [Escherichia coli O111:NM str. 2009C-4006]|nr:hypothetical protein BX59_02015 [Escherichia coli O111:NM str. 2010C-4086]EYV09377.1 hypothetical protein BX50_24720 [Escherichia coli O145:NM str. 2010C-3521]EYV11879.1 hypothetical protein BX51_18440 [Escherichia coli O145:NM str. 2010C-3526]EYV21767.1 hypothetical protein BX48_10665 [Escherichia coli O145:NM str. 2010C-3517]EYV29856.1 hypothetical protein BX49_22815 [Escherichia coli O145:NM str. 2010C-3518]EYV34508.1 hypothetical protein BX47_13875 [Escherichia coli O145:NM str. 2010C-3
MPEQEENVVPVRQRNTPVLTGFAPEHRFHNNEVALFHMIRHLVIPVNPVIILTRHTPIKRAKQITRSHSSKRDFLRYIQILPAKALQ